jgi:uncharacterized protein YbjT (DUF2867 family)
MNNDSKIELFFVVVSLSRLILSKKRMKAIVLGASGLVGSELVRQLIEDQRFEKVYLLSRKSLDFHSTKIENYTIDFEKIASFPFENQVDTLFIAFGTTKAIAGSKEKQFYIDVEIPSKIMTRSKAAGVRNCVLISSMGVSEKSLVFYSRMKAELDERAKKMNFEKLIILKPSMLDGDRKEKRAGEKFGISLLNLIGKTGLIENYRPIRIEKVANCMRSVVFDLPNGIHELVSKQLQAYS